MTAFEIRTPIRVRYKETDAMGIVHHSNYYTWFEFSRVLFMEELGYSCRRMEEEGISFAVLQTNCRYIRPARFDDKLEIVTRLVDIKGVRYTFQYLVMLDGVILAEGTTLHCPVNRDMRPMSLGKSHPDAQQKFADCIAPRFFE